MSLRSLEQLIVAALDGVSYRTEDGRRLVPAWLAERIEALRDADRADLLERVTALPGRNAHLDPKTTAERFADELMTLGEAIARRDDLEVGYCVMLVRVKAPRVEGENDCTTAVGGLDIASHEDLLAELLSHTSAVAQSVGIKGFVIELPEDEPPQEQQ